jgi:hypothetical protein
VSTNTGRLPSAPGSCASHEAEVSPSSSPKASIPSAVLLELADRCEKAEALEQRPLIREVIQTVHANEPRDLLNIRLEWVDTGAFLDAAVTLVPEGFTWGAICSRFVPHLAVVHLSWGHGGWEGHSDHSRSLAICAAALRARAASGIEAPSGVETGNTDSTVGESPASEAGDAQL